MTDLLDGVIATLHPGISLKELAVVLFSSCALLLIFKLTRFFYKKTEDSTLGHSGSSTFSGPAEDDLNPKTPDIDRNTLSTVLEEPEGAGHSNEPSCSLPLCESLVCLGVVRNLAYSLFDSCLTKLRLLKGTDGICLNDVCQLPCKDSVLLRIVDLELLKKPTFRDVELTAASPFAIVMKGKASISLRLDAMLSSAKLIQDKMLPLSLKMTNLSEAIFHLARDKDGLVVEAQVTFSLENDIGTVIDGVSLSLKDFLVRDERVIALANLADIPLTFRWKIGSPDRAASHGATDSWQHFSTACHRYALIDNKESEPSPSKLTPAITGPLAEEQLPNGDSPVTAVSTVSEQLPVTEPLLVAENAPIASVSCLQKAEGERLVLQTPQGVVFTGGVWKEIAEAIPASVETSKSAPDELPHPTLPAVEADRQVEEDLNPLRESKGEDTVSHPAQEGDSSSLSGISGISGSSTRTYTGEASTLVIETVTNGIVEHYLIPHGLADYTKLKKHGKKLHLFQDHAFVARHLPGGTKCGACGKSVGRLPPPIKQGYECRFCHLRCHKHCHVKVETYCPNSKAMEMELKYPRVNANGKLEF